MSDESKPEKPAVSTSEPKPEQATNSEGVEPESTAEQPPPPPPPHNETDRLDLINKARAFLASPQVRNEDIPAKRRFLAEKGLTDVEVNQLIQELPPQVPNIPPRTYPQPPPSNLPNLLVGVFRILTWVAGGSAAIILVYMRYILPRLTSSFQARSAIQKHQLDLFSKFNSSLQSLKETQTDAFTILPSACPDFTRRDAEFAQCQTVDELKAKFDVEKKDIPPVTLVRCTLASTSEKLTTEGVYEALEKHFPHLNLSQDAQLQEVIWQTLTSVPAFTSEQPSQSDQQPTWTYTAPSPPPPPAYITSLGKLKDALPVSGPAGTAAPSRFHRTLSSLTDFTGYLTTETYPLPYKSGGAFRPPGIHSGGSGATGGGGQHEDLKKEIRALKGLVLNRRTFTMPRPGSRTTPSAQSVSTSS